MSSAGSVQIDDIRGPGAFDRLQELERESAHIYFNQPLFLPGPFQVRGYATATLGRLSDPRPSDRDLADRVEIRLRRREAFEKRLAGDRPPHVLAVLDESVLRRAVGGPAVMREQLEHLMTLSKMETVRLAIVPLAQGAHAGLEGTFEVHEMADGRAAVFFEDAHGDALTGDDDRRYRQRAENIAASAATGADAVALLEATSKSF